MVTEGTVRARYGLQTGTVRFTESRREWPDAVPHRIRKVYMREEPYSFYLGVVYRSRRQPKQGRPDSWIWERSGGTWRGVASSEEEALERIARSRTEAI